MREIKVNMCKTCNGTGGINLEQTWGVTFHPCPSSDCDFDRDKEIRESDEIINKFKAEIYARKLDVS